MVAVVVVAFVTAVVVERSCVSKLRLHKLVQQQQQPTHDPCYSAMYGGPVLISLCSCCVGVVVGVVIGLLLELLFVAVNSDGLVVEAVCARASVCLCWGWLAQVRHSESLVWNILID